MTRTSPESLAAEQIAALGGQLAGIFHGNPDSIHQARVAARRLREILPLIDATDAATAVTAEMKTAGRCLGMWRPPRLLKDLRKFQSVLGELHDAETLLGSLDEFVIGAEISPRDVELVRQVLEGEIVGMQAQYVAARERILAVCDACERFAGAPPVQRRALIQPAC